MQVMKRKIRVILWQTILPNRRERLANVDEKDLGLGRRPVEAVTKGTASEADEPFHADVAQNMPALL